MDTLQMRGGGEKKPGSGSHRPEAGFRGDLHANSSAAGLPIEILAQALDCGPPTFIADVNGNISYTNTAFKQLQFDLSRGEIGPVGGMIADEPTDPSHFLPGAQAILEILSLIERGEDPLTRVERFAVGDKISFVRATHRPLRKDDGEIIAVIGQYQDLTDEAMLKNRVAEMRTRMDDITRLVSDWVWETDRLGQLTFVSPRIADLLGLHMQQVRGVCLTDLVTAPQSVAKGERAQGDGGPGLNLLSQQPFRDILVEAKSAHGTPRLMRLTGIPVFSDATGRFQGYRGVARDITEETRAWNSAAQSQAQLMTALDSINEIFVLFGSDDAMLLCNRVSLGLHPQASEIFVPGRSRSEIKQELINRGVLAPHVRLEDFEEGNGSFGSQMVMLELADGRHISIAEKTTPDGGTVMVAANISDTVEREIALRRAKEVAELASRTKSDFLANVSHELRTPLNAIIGFSEIMRDELLGPVGTPQYKDYMTSILDSGRHLLSLINDILDISKAEVGKLTLVEDIFDLNDTFKSVKTLVQERAWRAEVKLVVEIETEDTRVRADERKIKQILLNLLSNAIKFTLAGGSVSMILRRLDNGFLEIEVKDTGIGIAEEDIEVALTPFGQVDSRLNRKYDGTGLGLPLSVALVELHHGALAVESEPGVGTTITVSLPSGRVLDSKSLSKIS